MYNLIRFYNQNRKKIFKIILIIVLIIGIIQLLNYFIKINKENSNNMQSNIVENNTDNYKKIVSNKSAISGNNVSSTKLKKDTDIINNFFKYCNEGNIESAYEILTDECKEELYPTIEDFKNIYYLNVFNGKSKSYTVENWIGDIYQVNIIGDIISTGKLDNNETKQDYMTVIKNNDNYKLNINSYIGRKNLNKTTKYKNIEITITDVNTYMDYEIYNLSIKNSSDNTILLDINDDTKSVYLLDSKGMKYYFYNNEIINNRLLIKSKFSSNLQIKFSNSYSSSRNIKSIVFSKVILNYEEYSNLEDKSQYKDFTEYKVNI